MGTQVGAFLCQPGNIRRSSCRVRASNRLSQDHHKGRSMSAPFHFQPRGAGDRPIARRRFRSGGVRAAAGCCRGTFRRGPRFSSSGWPRSAWPSSASRGRACARWTLAVAVSAVAVSRPGRRALASSGGAARCLPVRCCAAVAVSGGAWAERGMRLQPGSRRAGSLGRLPDDRVVGGGRGCQPAWRPSMAAHRGPDFPWIRWRPAAGHTPIWRRRTTWPHCWASAWRRPCTSSSGGCWGHAPRPRWSHGSHWAC